MSPRLQVRGLRVAFDGRVVVDSLDLDVESGEVVGLVGPSGSGKSLTARAILGLPPPGAQVSGSVRLDGRELLGLSEPALCAVRGRGIGMVFQEPSTALDPVMPIGEQVAEGLRVHRLASGAQARVEARAWLDRVGLEAIPSTRRPHQLSGGQRQRVAIAAAVALKPSVLLADEPTTALDAVIQAEVAALLGRLAREEAMSLLVISHDVALVAGLASRLVVLQDGRAVASGPLRQVLEDPDPRVRALRQAAVVRGPRPAPAEARRGEPVLRAIGLRRTYAPARSWRAFAERLADEDVARAGVHEVSLELHAGERLAMVGETGAGKSTLLRLLLGLDRPQGGEVHLCGRLFSPAPAATQRSMRRHIQPVFQDPASSFDPRWSVARTVAEPLGLLDAAAGSNDVAGRVAEALQAVGLSPSLAERPARALSGGQRQRVALARALVVAPQVLVLDEATSALDPASRAEVLDLLASLSERSALACLMVTHDLASVRGFADRIAVLHEGRIVETGATADIFARPRHAYTQALLAATPDLEQVLAARRSF